MRIVQLAIFWFIIGSLLFLIKAVFSHGNEPPDIYAMSKEELIVLINSYFEGSTWDSIYFFWDKGTDVLLFAGMMELLSKQYKWLVQPVLAYCIIGLLWEIINLITPIGINHPRVVTAFFLSLLIGVVILLITDLKKRWKQN